MNSNENIKSYGLFSSLAVTTVGVGIFSYPRQLATAVGNEGWIVTIVAGLIFMPLVYLIYKISYYNDFQDFHIIIFNCFGRILGFIILLIFSFYMIFLVSLQMRSFVEVIKMYLLEKTPTEFLIIGTILVASHVVRSGERSIIKFNEIAFWIMFLPIAFMFLALIPISDFTNMLPVFQKPIDNYTKGLFSSLVSFAGFEILFFIMPIFGEKKKIYKTSVKAITFIMIFYVLIVIFTLAVFGESQLKIVLWPTITMVTAIDLPGTFVERWEGVVMALWILFYLTTFINYYYFSSHILTKIIKVRNVKISSVLIIPLIYVLALYPNNINELYEIGGKYLNPLIVFCVVILPIFLFIISAIKFNRKGRSVYEKN